MCGRQSRPRWPALWLSVLLASVSATLWAEVPETQTSPPPSAPPPSSARPQLTLLGTVSLLSELSTTLVDESTALARESRELSVELEKERGRLSDLQTELNGLRLSRDSFKASWNESLSSYARLESTALEAIDAEALKAARAERTAGRWRTGALVTAAFAFCGWAAFAVTIF